jgi:hypothetical protein
MILKPADYPLWVRIVVVVTLTLFAVNLFFFIGPLTAVVISARELIGAKEILTGIGSLVATLFATYIGARLAFKFQRLKSDQERIDEEVAAGNRALFTLTEMYNQTVQHQKETVDQVRGKPAAWFNLRAYLPLSRDLSFDTQELPFLLHSYPVVFHQVLLEESRFKLFAYMIEDHRSVIFTVIWPRLEAAGITHGQPLSIGELKQVLGPGAAGRLETIGEGIIKNCDENVASLKKAILDLRQTLKRIYPERKFINFKFLDDEATS